MRNTWRSVMDAKKKSSWNRTSSISDLFPLSVHLKQGAVQNTHRKGQYRREEEEEQQMAKQRRQPASAAVAFIVTALLVLMAIVRPASGQFTDDVGDGDSSPPQTTPGNSPSSSSTPSFTSVTPTSLKNCPSDSITFELITGYVYSAPADMLDSQPGTLMLTDCIDTCRKNTSCQSINYETGLCVLFSSNSDSTPGKTIKERLVD